MKSEAIKAPEDTFELPTRKEELTMKTAEAYEDLLDKYEKGIITASELDCAVSALMTATSWGISDKLFRLMSESLPFKKGDNLLRKITLVPYNSDGKFIYILAIDFAAYVVTVRSLSLEDESVGWQVKKIFDLSDKIKPAEACVLKCRQIIDHLMGGEVKKYFVVKS